MRASIFALATATFAAAPLSAQDTPPTAWGRAPDAHATLSSAAAAWLGGWSPLRPISESYRGELRAPLAPGLLDAPPPIAGAFFLSGAPGALAKDIRGARGSSLDTSRFADIRFRTSGSSGTFRRPLDPGEASNLGVNGQGWSHIGSRGVAIGRFSVDREALDVSSFTSRVAPYASSPFLATDSVSPPMQRTRARLEGALGWTIAGVGVGVAGGLESREHTTTDFPLRRAGRSANPALSIGAQYGLPWLDASVGAYRRWIEASETDILNPSPLPTVYYPLRGYDEPISVPISSVSLFTRVERSAAATGFTLSAKALGTRVSVSHERGEQGEEGIFAVQEDPATNQWRASGPDTRIQLQRPFGERTTVTIVAVDEETSGQAVRLDLDGIAYRAVHKRRAIEGDVRTTRGRWSAAVIGGVISSAHTVSDFVAELGTNVDHVQTFISTEAAVRFERAALAVGIAGTSAAGSGIVPRVADRQENYQRLIAPMIAYDGAEARAYAWWISGAYRIGGQTLIAGARNDRASPSREAPSRLQPSGSRSGWSASIGLRY